MKRRQQLKISSDLYELIKEMHYKYRILKEQEEPLTEKGKQAFSLFKEADAALDQSEGIDYDQ